MKFMPSDILIFVLAINVIFVVTDEVTGGVDISGEEREAFGLKNFIDNRPKCQLGMFSVELKSISVVSQSVRVTFRLGLAPSCVLDDQFTVFEYVTQCLDRVVFRARSRQSQRETLQTYKIRDLDDLNRLEQEMIGLDAVSMYNLEIGYQMKSPFTERVYQDSREFETCFDAPPKPQDMTIRLFVNASYLIEWKDPVTAGDSPPICYYLVDIRRQSSGGGSSRQVEVTDRFYYVSKEESRQKAIVSVHSVLDIRCLTGSYPNINNCVNKRLTSSAGSSFEIGPAVDYTQKGRAGSTYKAHESIYHYCLLFISTVVIILYGSV